MSVEELKSINDFEEQLVLIDYRDENSKSYVISHGGYIDVIDNWLNEVIEIDKLRWCEVYDYMDVWGNRIVYSRRTPNCFIY